MRNTSRINIDNAQIFSHAYVNSVQQGDGLPIVLLHGIAASLHDWDELVPELIAQGYAVYALDLLGHGASAKPDSRAYQIDWLFEHLVGWVDSLCLAQEITFIGHSLGGYLALEFARHYPQQTRGLVLSNPFYKPSQLSPLLRLSYRRPRLNSLIIERTPHWLWRMIIDATSLSLGRTAGALYYLPEKVRSQTAQDYRRTAPGVYNLPNTMSDLTSGLPGIEIPSLVIWGDHDLTLNPDSFDQLVKSLANAEGKLIRGAGHVAHQSNPAEFNQVVLDFMTRFGSRQSKNGSSTEYASKD